jgi:tetratricopeptide (TPR) repeat protein
MTEKASGALRPEAREAAREERRQRRRRPAGALRRSLPYFLGLACVLAVGLFGTLTGWSVALASLLMGLAALFAAYLARREGTAIGETHWALLAITAWTALSLVPLPASLVESVSPESVIDARDTARALGDPIPGTATLSRSPTDTQRELLKAAAICAAFFAGCVVIQLGSRRAAVIAGASGAIAAGILTVAHVIADAESVYGIYHYPWPPRLMGPIGNQNHLSGLMAMAVPALLGVAIDTTDRMRRGMLLFAATFCGSVALAAISRGGAISLGLGLLVLGLLLALHARRKGDAESLRRALLALGGLLTVGVLLTMAAYVFGETLAHDFEASPTRKLELAAEGLVAVGESPWLGVGRGAFRIAYTHLDGSDRLYYPENLLVQWSSEWGVPATLLLLVTLGGAFFVAVRRAESATQMGALAAVLGMFVHDQVDFALEQLAIALSASVLLAAAFYRSPSPRGKDQGKTAGTRRARILSWTPAVLTVALALVLGASIHHADARRLEQALLAMNEAGEWDATEALASDAMRLHPSEPIFPLVLGWAAASNDATGSAADAPRWLNRAMALAPDWPSPHLVTARWLARRGRLEQAWLEVREAERFRPGVGHQEICLFIRASATPDTVMRVFAGEPRRDAVLNQAASCAEVAPAISDAIDRDLIGTAESSVAAAARIRLAWRSIRAGETDEALVMLDGAREAAGDDEVLSWNVRLARADALLRGRRPSEAAEVIDARAPLALEARRLDVLARCHAAAGNVEGMRAAVTALRAFAAGSGPRLAANALLLGRLEEQLGNAGHAYAAYDDAQRLDPESGALARTAALAEREGDLRRAYLALSQLCRARGEGSAECRSADAMRERSEHAP